jgi:hypothetical protein
MQGEFLLSARYYASFVAALSQTAAFSRQLGPVFGTFRHFFLGSK